MTVRTLVIGEALVDIVHEPNGSVHEHVGGSPLNVAVGLARLGHAVELMTSIGEDHHGRLIDEHLGHDFVPLSPGSRSAAQTATALATTDETGAAHYDFSMEWDITAVPTGFQHVHAGSIAAVLAPGADAVHAAMERARPAATVSYDPNSRPTLMGDPDDVRPQMERLIALCDVVKASDEDIEWLYGDVDPGEIAQEWGSLGPAVVVVTRGADGALVHLPRVGETHRVPGRPARVADTVGAGDSFMSGLLSGLLDHGLLGGPDARERLGQDSRQAVLEAVDRAIRASAITVSRPGAQPPKRDEID